jgi:hypothetical protein
MPLRGVDRLRSVVCGMVIVRTWITARISAHLISRLAIIPHTTLCTPHSPTYTTHTTLGTAFPPHPHTHYTHTTHTLRTHYAPCIIHLTPYTIHHIPYTIHHTPYITHHTPHTTHHTPHTTHHAPHTMHHTPCTTHLVHSPLAGCFCPRPLVFSVERCQERDRGGAD